MAQSLLRDLLRRARLLAPVEVAGVVAQEAARCGLADTAIYVVDYEQERLVRLPAVPEAGPGRGVTPEPSYESVAVDGSVPGLAFSRVDLVETAVADGVRMHLPLLLGMERLGVLVVTVPDAEYGEVARDLALVVAQLVAVKALRSDYLERARRREPMSLAAEMQWALLPPLTFGSERLVVSGLLEPCYEVGGDAFDYALDADAAVVGIFDAMGHGVEASLLSSLAVGAYRNSRRIGLDLRDTFTEIDRVLSRHREGEGFVTGVIGRLDLATGRLSWVNAGHLAPLLVRGGKVVKRLAADPALPFGLGDQTPDPVDQALEPGDRLLLFTDGVVEAQSLEGEFFGEERLIDVLRKADSSHLPAAETMRRLKVEIVTHQAGHLRDDATLLAVEWRGAGGGADAAARAAGESV